MKLWFFKLGRNLVAADEEAEDAIARIAHGEALLIDIRRPRNLKFHRKYWALIATVFDNQERYPTREHLHVAVKLAAGWFDSMVLEDGRLVYVPRSISFAAMDEDEFTKFYSEAVGAIIRLLPQFNAEFLLEAVSEFAPR